jgi:Lon protease-like protein
MECLRPYEKMRIEFAPEQPEETQQEMDFNEMRDALIESAREVHNNVRELRAEVSYSEDVPTMSA